MSHVNLFEVEDPNIMSDHCMIDFMFTFDIDNCNQTVRQNIQTSEDNINFKYVWNKSEKNNYVDSLFSTHIQSELHVLNNAIDVATCPSDIDKCIKDLSVILDTAIPQSCKRHVSQHSIDMTCKTGNTPQCNNWFTNECIDKRWEFYAALNLYRQK